MLPSIKAPSLSKDFNATPYLLLAGGLVVIGMSTLNWFDNRSKAKDEDEKAQALTGIKNDAAHTYTFVKVNSRTGAKGTPYKVNLVTLAEQLYNALVYNGDILELSSSKAVSLIQSITPQYMQELASIYNTRYRNWFGYGSLRSLKEDIIMRLDASEESSIARYLAAF